jgi:hypothetical protein
MKSPRHKMCMQERFRGFDGSAHTTANLPGIAERMNGMD